MEMHKEIKNLKTYIKILRERLKTNLKETSLFEDSSNLKVQSARFLGLNFSMDKGNTKKNFFEIYFYKIF
jgi:aspartate/tyrosine/aromatic aminotransferase